MAKKVWLVVDEKYGPQAAFDNKKAAEFSCDHDMRLAICGYRPWVEPMEVLSKPTVSPKPKRGRK